MHLSIGGTAACGRSFFVRANQHGMNEICADDAGFSGAREGESQIARTTAEIEDQSVRSCEDGPQETGDAGAPEAVQPPRQQGGQPVGNGGGLRGQFADSAWSVPLALL